MSIPKLRRSTAALLALTLLLGGCFGGRVQKPGNSIAEAEMALTRAEQARVGDYDAADLRSARENLASAHAAADAAAADDRKAQAQSRWFAARAKADAELAISRAEATRLRALVLSLQGELDDAASARIAP